MWFIILLVIAFAAGCAAFEEGRESIFLGLIPIAFGLLFGFWGDEPWGMFPILIGLAFYGRFILELFPPAPPPKKVSGSPKKGDSVSVQVTRVTFNKKDPKR